MRNGIKTCHLVSPLYQNEVTGHVMLGIVQLLIRIRQRCQSDASLSSTCKWPPQADTQPPERPSILEIPERTGKCPSSSETPPQKRRRSRTTGKCKGKMRATFPNGKKNGKNRTYGTLMYEIRPFGNKRRPLRAAFLLEEQCERNDW